MPNADSRPDAERIRSMFGAIAGRYDLANTLLSGGVHHLWRRKAVRYSGAKSGDKVLDCATGTGDLAIEYARAVGPTGTVIGTDFCPEMLEPAPAKAAASDVTIEFAEADVTDLPYESDRFDIASISFGIRNVSDPAKGLSELARVTRSGGVVLVLEFGQPTTPGFRNVYNWYSNAVLPRLGGLVTGKGWAYRYLQDSSSKFPCRNEFVDMMLGTDGFEDVTFETLTGGIAYLYRGVVR